jgi:ankyrin repeat protein
VEAAQALITAGANCKAANSMTGATPLHMVAQSSKSTLERRLAVVELLLAAGADPSQADQRGSVPADFVSENEPELKSRLAPKPPALVQAIQDRNVAAVQELIAQPEYVEHPDASFRDKTPLSLTVYLLLSVLTDQEDESEEQAQAFVEILQLLLNTNASVPPDDDSPLHALLGELQAQEDDSSWQTRLLQTAILFFPIDSCIPPDGWQLLQKAARRDDLFFLTFLVEQLQLDPNLKGRQGMTALQFAARSGKLNVLVCTYSRTTLCVTTSLPLKPSHPRNNSFSRIVSH